MRKQYSDSGEDHKVFNKLPSKGASGRNTFIYNLFSFSSSYTYNLLNEVKFLMESFN